jgi:hypothetical protein
MSPSPRRLAPFVAPNLDDKRIDRVWEDLSRRTRRTPFAWKRAALAAAAAVAAMVVLSVAMRARVAAPLAGWVVESGDQQVVTLPDGTRAALRSGARLRWDRLGVDRVEATVERGGVAFDVRHDGSRAFVVHAAGVDVVDRGTRFVVDVQGAAVAVSVEQGRLEVVRSGSPRVLLGAGDAWTSGVSAVARQPAGVSGAAPPPEVASAAEPATVPSDAPVGSTPAIEAREPTPPPPSAPDVGARAAAEPRVTAQDLLQTANDARLLGRPREAAAAFDALRRRFRSDRRAGLAAFELARLRLDALDDPAGAVEALTDTVALAPAASFREDADARLVEAFDRMHDVRRCEAAQRSYIAHYPRGLHAAVVASRCH